MEKPSATKKKKRRTRKCLDEIRKRSRRLTRGDNFGHRVEEFQAQNNLVTINRLTLKMFPKAIRSETITRPLLEGFQQKSSYRKNNFDKNKINNASGSLIGHAIKCTDQYNSAASDNSMPLFMSENNTEDDNLCNQSELPLTNYLKSHSLSPQAAQTPQVNEATIHSTTTSSSSSQADNGDHGSQFYEEFMDEISSHLQRVTSALFKEDILKPTKLNLQRLYYEIQSRECNTKLIDYKKYIPSKDSIVQNPLDYLRLQQVDKQGTHTACDGRAFSVAVTTTQPSVAGRLHSSTLPLSAHLPCTPDKECTALYETPEYKYYPHRLN